MRRREFIGTAAMIGGSVLLGSSIFGCTTQQPAQKTPTPKPEKPIKIGFLGPLSGPFTPWGDGHLKGAKMAVEEINASGGVDGRKLELVVRDTKNNASEAATVFEELVFQEGVVAVIGPVSSDIGLATSRKAEELNVPLLLHMAGSDKILTKSSRYTFRTALVAGPLLMQALAEYIKDKGFTRIGAIIADYAWGHSIEGGIKKYIETLPGVEVRMEVAPVKESDFTPYLRKMQDLNPELVIATGHPPGTAKIARQGIELGFNAKYIGPNIPKKVWEKILGEDVTKGMLDFTPVNYNSNEFQSFAQKFYEKYKEEVDFAGTTGYVNINHIVWAIKQANSAEPKDIANTIRGGSYNTPLFAFPLSYTSWGDQKEAREVIITFKPGAPPYGPDSISHAEVEFISPPIKPVEPSQ